MGTGLGPGETLCGDGNGKRGRACEPCVKHHRRREYPCPFHSADERCRGRAAGVDAGHQSSGGGHWPTGKGRGAVSSATVQLCWRMETGGLAESSSGGTAAWRRRRLSGRRRGHGRWAGIGFSSVSIAAARLGNFMSRSRRRPSVCQDRRAGLRPPRKGRESTRAHLEM